MKTQKYPIWALRTKYRNGDSFFRGLSCGAEDINTRL